MLTRARKRLVAGLVALVAVSGATLVAAPPASAANGCNVEYVRSNAMNRTVPVCIVSAGGGGPKPTLYLLDGLRAPPNNNSGWLINTDVARYMAGKAPTSPSRSAAAAASTPTGSRPTPSWASTSGRPS